MKVNEPNALREQFNCNAHLDLFMNLSDGHNYVLRKVMRMVWV